MKVKTLIKQLQAVDGELEVRVRDNFTIDNNDSIEEVALGWTESDESLICEDAYRDVVDDGGDLEDFKQVLMIELSSYND